jgi:HTH-type transcriptional regulator/antitoxin HigA
VEEVTTFPQELHDHWAALSPLLSIRSEPEYDLAVKRLNELLDEVGNDEHHALYTLLETLGTLVHAYEEQHHPMPECSGSDLLAFLVEEHSLTPSDLPEIGSRAIVSELLRGKRELNVRQIRALAKRFHVSPALFL